MVYEPEEEETKAFAEYMEKYEKGLPSIRKAANGVNLKIQVGAFYNR
jgi:hypothetical protein